MNISDCYKIGFIAKPHGLKGSVTAILEHDLPNDAGSLDAVFLSQNEMLVPYFIKDISATGNKAYILFEDVDSIESAQAITRCSLYLPKSVRPKSAKGEFYDDEVMGFAVIDQDAGTLGTVGEVVKSGLQKLLAVMNADKEILIPINDVFIKKIDHKKKEIHTVLPEGFLDL